MPSIIKSENLKSDGTYYPLQGSQYEYLPWDCRLEFGIVFQDHVTTDSTNECVMNIFSGSDILVQNGSVPHSSNAPVYPDDFLISDVAAAGERISVEIVAKASGDGITVRTVARLTPV